MASVMGADGMAPISSRAVVCARARPLRACTIGAIMHVHIIGICGTFMGGIAAIARASGHRVSGSDRNVYPPMSTQLAALGIELSDGFGAAQLEPRPDVVVVGNVRTRGMPVIEA